MNTPPEFEPGVALPEALAPETLCFVWRDDKILARDVDPPELPTLSDVMRLGIDGTRHYLGRYRGVAKGTGKRLDVPFVHVWTLHDGKAVRFRQFLDTAGWVEALSP